MAFLMLLRRINELPVIYHRAESILFELQVSLSRLHKFEQSSCGSLVINHEREPAKTADGMFNIAATEFN